MYIHICIVYNIYMYINTTSNNSNNNSSNNDNSNNLHAHIFNMYIYIYIHMSLSVSLSLSLSLSAPEPSVGRFGRYSPMCKSTLKTQASLGLLSHAKVWKIQALRGPFELVVAVSFADLRLHRSS